MRPYVRSSLRVSCYRGIKGSTHHLANRVSGLCSPTRMARIEYPVLCQSMISLHPVAHVRSCAIMSVGIDGGFCY